MSEIIYEGMTHLELLQARREAYENNVADYEYISANEFDMRLDFYGDDVSAETEGE